MASFESMSDVELRKKLVEYGFDIPVAGNRDFIIKKLAKLQEGPGKGRSGGRKSTPVIPPQRPTPPPPTAPATTNNVNNGLGGGTPRPNCRLSLNDSGAGSRRSASRESDRLLLPPSGRAGSSRRSVGSAIETASNKSNSSASGRQQQPQRKSLPLHSISSSSRLRQVEETVEDEDDEDEEEEEEEEESSSEDDSVLVDGSMNGDHNNHHEQDEDKMEVDIRPLQTSSSNSFRRQPTTPSRNTSYTRMNTTANSSSMFSTKTIPRAGVHHQSPPAPAIPPAASSSFYSANNTSNSSSTPGGPSSSSRFEKYYNYFRSSGDSRQEGDPMLFSFTRSPGTGGYFSSPSSTAATMGSPSFNRSYLNNTSFMNEDCSADEEEEEDFETEGAGGEGRTRRWLRKLNPINLVRGMLFWGGKKSEDESEDEQTDRMMNSSSPPTRPAVEENNSYGRAFSQQQQQRQSLSGLGTSRQQYSYSTSTSPGRGIPVGGPASAAVARHLYPPTRVPPAVAEGRQAGFQMFSSRGETNGVGSGGGIGGWAWDGTTISKGIVIALFVLFGTIAVTYYVKSLGVNNEGDAGVANGSVPAANSIPAKKPAPTPPKEVKTNRKYCICGDGVSNCEVCISKEHVRTSKKLVELLKGELVQRANWKGCTGDDKLNIVSAKKVAAGLIGMKISDIEPVFKGALVLINENPDFGLVIESDGKENVVGFSTKEVLNWDPETSFITAVGAEPHTLCVLWAWISNLIFYLICFAILALAGYLGYRVVMARQSKKKQEEEEIYQTVQEVIEMLREQQDRSKVNSSIEGYLAINHIRDSLIAPQDRKKKEGLWKAVVNHISTQESRVREEVQHLSGEEYQVWRWMSEASPLPSPITNRKKSFRPSSSNLCSSSGGSGDASFSAASPRLYPSLDSISNDLSNFSANGEDSLWQGQAFEVNAGSPNALMKIPSTCLKIRQMYDPTRGIDDERRTIIGRSIHQKCGGSKILHIGIDPKASDGSVYLLCQSKEDARSAFSALHGWWFEGNLLSVKFLREERYFERFPDAKVFYNIPNPMISGQGGFRDQLTGFNK